MFIFGYHSNLWFMGSATRSAQPKWVRQNASKPGSVELNGFAKMHPKYQLFIV